MINETDREYKRWTLAEAANWVRNGVGCNPTTGQMYDPEEVIDILERFAAGDRLLTEWHGGMRHVWTQNLGSFTRYFKWVVMLHDEDGRAVLTEFLRMESVGLKQVGKPWSDPVKGSELAVLLDDIESATTDLHDFDARVYDAGPWLQNMKDDIFSKSEQQHQQWSPGRRLRTLYEEYWKRRLGGATIP